MVAQINYDLSVKLWSSLTQGSSVAGSLDGREALTISQNLWAPFLERETSQRYDAGFQYQRMSNDLWTIYELRCPAALVVSAGQAWNVSKRHLSQL